MRIEKQLQMAFAVTAFLAFPILPAVLVVFIAGSVIGGLQPLTIFMDWEDK